jgi:hypothetical protein
MKIYFRHEKIRLPIFLPTALLTSRLSASILAKVSKKSGVYLSAKELRPFMRAVKKSHKILKRTPLVEVETSDGTYVKIIL